MRILREIRYRLRAIMNRGDMERELDAELRDHIEREAEKLMRTGLPRAEAERRARASFGGVERIKEDARDSRGVALLESIVQDGRYAWRGLRARKTFTVGVVLTLGLGIGANATMFGITDRLLFRAPPTLHDPAAVHRIYRHRSDESGDQRIDRNFSFPTYTDLIRDTHSFSAFAAFQTRRLAIGDGDASKEADVTTASASFFRFFDARPALGTFFADADDSVPAGAPVVVLSYGLWQTRFGGRNVIGEQLRVDRTVRTIIGVAPKDFVGMSDQGVPSAYIPITSYAFAMRGTRYPPIYTWSWMEIIARRKPDVTVAAANTDLTSAFVQSWRTMAAADPGWGSLDQVHPRGELGPVQVGRGPQAGRDARVAEWVTGVALIVLLIACANVANLLLSRAVSRRREIAVRLALGVSRARLIRQLLTESVLLTVLGGVVGLAFAQWGSAGIRTLFLPPEFGAAVFTDPRTLLFAGAAMVVAALLTGLVPAMHAGRADVSSVLKAGAREGSYQRSRLRATLLVAQAALSVVLLVGAGLFVRSLGNVRGYRMGYDTQSILFAAANPRGVRMTDAEQAALNDRLLAASLSVPGISHATLAASVPFWSNEGRGLYVPGVDSVQKLGRFILQVGSPDYFSTTGTRILSGRGFTSGERSGTERVAVVSQGMAHALWPAQDAIGKCFKIDSAGAPCTTVIGVAENVRVRSLTDPREFAYYIPAAQYSGVLDPQLFVRADGRVSELVEPLRRRLQAEMPGAAYINVMPLSALIDPSLRAWQFGATMFAAFGGLALILAAIGLYSLIAYDVAQRTRDLSVRIALGASASRVMRIVVLRGVRLVAVGVAGGGAIALWVAPKLQSLMFQQEPRDPVVFGGVAAALLGVCLVATAVPAFRASRVDPNLALRGE